MPKFQPAAEKAFAKKLSKLLSEAVRKIDRDSEELPDQACPLTVAQPLDVEATTRLFFQYGNYLELIDAPARKDA